MKKSRLLRNSRIPYTLASAIAAMLATQSAHAASGTWTQTTTGGNWSTIGNWSGGTIADASGSTADFSTLNITADNTVHLDSSRTLTNLNFGDTDTSSAASWILDNNENSANVLTLTGTPTITVKPLGTGKTATISAEIAGTAGLTKYGIGIPTIMASNSGMPAAVNTLVLSGANTYTGTTTIGNGMLQIGNGTTGSLGSTPSTYAGALTFTGTGTFNVQQAAGSAQNMGALTFSAGEGNVLLTAASASSTLTFASMNARSVGATADFYSATSTTAKIGLTDSTNAPTTMSNAGIFYKLDRPGIEQNQPLYTTDAGYARYDTTTNTFRPVNYGSGGFGTGAGDANTATTLTTSTASTTDVLLTAGGAVTGASLTCNTLRFSSNNVTFASGAGSVLSVNGIMLESSSASKAVGVVTTTSYIQPVGTTGELVLAAYGNGGVYGATTGGALQIGAIIRDNGGTATNVTKGGVGMVIVLANGASSPHTYTGATYINSGVLRVFNLSNGGGASSLGASSNAAGNLVINGGALQIGNGTTGTTTAQSTNRAFTIGPAGATLDAQGSSNGSVVIGSGGGSILFSDPNAPTSLTLTGIGTGTSAATLAAVLGNPTSNTASLSKLGTGTWSLSAANTHKGNTVISAGKILMTNALALQYSAYDTTGSNGTTIGLDVTSGLGSGSLKLGGLTGSVTLGSAITAGYSSVSALTLQPQSGTVSYSGVIANGSGSMTLTKTGAGTQALSGVSTYTGATAVNAGKLIINGSGSINNSSGTTVAAGARLIYNSSTALTSSISLSGDGTSSRAVLGGSGTIGASVTLDNFGDTLSPGNSPGIQTFTPAQTWSSFSYDWEVNNFTGTTAGTDFDQIGLGSTLDLTGGSYILNILSLTASNVGGNVPNFSDINRSWSILTSTGITGFNAANWAINTAGFTDTTTGTWGISQSSNDLVLSYTVVPETNVAALLGGFATLVLLRRRR